jgi:peptidoglycan-associated lipoprotein
VHDTLTNTRGALTRLVVAALCVATLTAAACAKKQPPVARPVPPPPTTGAPTTVDRPPAPPAPAPEPAPPAATIEESDLSTRSLDELNRESPFQPVFFDYDSFDISQAGQASLGGNAALLRKFPTWVVTIEGHCDERGTAEYNLALGEKRAIAAKNYLVSLGIPADRLRVVSYGKEFPFDPGHTESAWSKNRRAHFVITAK